MAKAAQLSIPTSCCSIGHLSCLGSMAMSRFDFEEAYRIYDILKDRFGAATCDGDRVVILEALYHATGYETRVQGSWMAECHDLFDNFIPDSLVTDRLLFYRFCRSGYYFPSPRLQTHTAWMEKLRRWADELCSSEGNRWEGQDLLTHFLRLRYIAQTGYTTVANSLGTQASSPASAILAQEYRQRVRSCFFDCLLSLFRADTTNVPTLVAAYNALRCIMDNFQKEEQRYKKLMARVKATQLSCPKDSTHWIQLEALKVDYENLTPIYFRTKSTQKLYKAI